MVEKELYNFKYKVYSFQIHSAFAIPELLRCEDECSNPVFIKFEKTIENVQNPTYKTQNIQFSLTRIVIDIDQVAKYSIENGNCINILTYEGVTDKEIRHHLIGHAFEAIMFQREILPLHGSAIIINKHAYILSGMAGCGKSTLAAWFIKNGYSILADDVCVLALNNMNKIIVHHGYPRIKLWTDSIVKLDSIYFENLVDRNIPRKYSICLENEFYTETAELKGIFFMETKNKSKITFNTPENQEIKSLLDQNIFRINFFQNTLENSPFNLYLETLQSINIIRKVIRPKNKFDVEYLFQSIEKDILDLN